MIISNPMLLGVLIFSGVVLLAVIAFWIVYGIKKYNWAMIASIVVTSMFVMMLGMSGIRLIASKTVHGPLAPNNKVESLMEKKDLGFEKKKGQFMEGKKLGPRNNIWGFKDFRPDKPLESEQGTE